MGQDSGRARHTYWQILMVADVQGTNEPICAMVTIAPSARM
jgi:hypothetical protein